MPQETHCRESSDAKGAEILLNPSVQREDAEHHS